MRDWITQSKFFQEILEKAKEEKRISYSELTKLLPADYFSGEILDELIVALNEQGIEVYEEKLGRKRRKRAKDYAIDEEDFIQIRDDPSRTYLKQISNLPLLTKEEEQKYSKMIDDSRKEIIRLVFSTKYGLVKLLQAIKLVEDGVYQIEEVVQVDSQYWTSKEKNEQEKKRVKKAFSSIKRTINDLFEEYFEVDKAEVPSYNLKNSQKKLKRLAERIVDLAPQFSMIGDIVAKMEEMVKEMDEIREKLIVLEKQRDELVEKMNTQGELDPQEERALGELFFDIKELNNRMKEIENSLGMTPEEAKEHFVKIKVAMDNMEYAKRKMTEGNVRLVIGFAKRFMNRGLEFMDLVQEGNAGLLKAVEKFDYRKGFKFSTYATWWIRQSITRAIADQSRTIRIPIHMIETITKVSRAARALMQEYGREPTIEEIANYLDIPQDKVKQALDSAKEPISVDRPIGHDEKSFIGDFLVDRNQKSPKEYARDNILKEKLEEVLNTLSPREKKILEYRFGLRGHPPKTLDEVGKIFDVTRERVRQIEAKALKKLKHPMRIAKLRRLLDEDTRG